MMSGCKYCDGCYSPFIDFEIDMGIFGKASIQTVISFIDDIEMFTSIDLNGGDTEAIGSARINYCPFCGRKLEDEGGD